MREFLHRIRMVNGKRNMKALNKTIRNKDLLFFFNSSIYKRVISCDFLLYQNFINNYKNFLFFFVIKMTLRMNIFVQRSA